jgi:hypothetical protein
MLMLIAAALALMVALYWYGERRARRAFIAPWQRRRPSAWRAFAPSGSRGVISATWLRSSAAPSAHRGIEHPLKPLREAQFMWTLLGIAALAFIAFALFVGLHELSKRRQF